MENPGPGEAKAETKQPLGTFTCTQPIRTAEPNSMHYTDDKGVEHDIYLPQGTMHRAWEYLQNEQWDELAKFEPYTNQGYTEDDFKAYEESHKHEGQGK